MITTRLWRQDSNVTTVYGIIKYKDVVFVATWIGPQFKNVISNKVEDL